MHECPKITESYRGHEITVWREECLAGYELLYFSIFRESDGYECASGYTYDDSDLQVYAGYLRSHIDSELLDPDPWGEQYDA